MHARGLSVFVKKVTPTQLFSSKFCKIFSNSFFLKTPPDDSFWVYIFFIAVTNFQNQNLLLKHLTGETDGYSFVENVTFVHTDVALSIYYLRCCTNFEPIYLVPNSEMLHHIKYQISWTLVGYPLSKAIKLWTCCRGWGS